MIRRAPVAALLVLVSCRQTPVELVIPVARPCVSAADLPPPVPPAGSIPDDARQAADLLGAVVLALRANERVLRALIAPCAY